MSLKNEVHITDLYQYCSCRRAWGWSSLMRRGLEPAIPPLPLFMGLGFHTAMEYGYQDSINQEHAYFDVDDGLNAMYTFARSRIQKAQDYIGVLWRDNIQKMKDSLDLLESMVRHYALWADVRDKKLQVEGTEEIFSVPIPDSDLFYGGRFDGLVTAKDGNMYIMEYKTAASLYSSRLNSIFRGIQASGYMWAARQMGYPVNGVIYRVAHKHKLDYPQPLQRGGYSVNKRQWLSVESVQAWADASGVVRSEVADLIALCKTFEYSGKNYQGNKFFYTRMVRRSDRQLDHLEEVLRTIGAEMADPNTEELPVPGWHCTYCKFRHPCELLDADMIDHAEASLSAEFAPRFYWDDDDDDDGLEE